MDPRRRSQIVWGLLLAAAAVAAATGALELFWHGRLFAARAAFPLDLEWMEGGMLVHAQRLAEGKPLYVKPSLDFIPFLYTPFYYALLAALSKLVPLGYALGRAVSLLALAGALALLVIGAWREAARWPGRAVALLVGLAGAGAVVAGFEFSGAFYDLARSDSLLLALEAGALAAALWGRSLPSAAAAGGLMALAFLTKQTGPVVGVGIGLGLLVANWRRGLVYGGVAGVLMGLGLLYLVNSSDGWFWTYIYKLHQSHPFRLDTLTWSPPYIWHHAWPTLAALAAATVGLALGGRLRRSDAILAGAVVGGLGAGILGFATMWAWTNAFIPTVYFPTFAAAVLAARLLASAADGRWPLLLLANTSAILLAVQNVNVGKPNFLLRAPQPSDRAAATRFLERLRALGPGGYVPFHPFYGVLAGGRPYVHRMGVKDVEGSLGRPEGLDQAILQQRFPWIIIDSKSMPGEWPGLDTRYRVSEEFHDGWNSPRMFAGADTSPRWLMVPIREAPPVPPGGHRVFDFEFVTWRGWTWDGGAFGQGPFSAPDGMFGHGAASSARFGPVNVGTVRSPAFKLDRPHLRFLLGGPADPALKASLLVGGEPVRTASPHGPVAPVEWDVSNLVGKDAVFLLEDHSPSGGLVADELVAY